LKHRRHSRFLLTHAWPGELKICDDVVLEKSSGDRIWISSLAPARDGDAFTLAVMANGSTVAISVRAVDCRPAPHLGLMWHRIGLAATPADVDALQPLLRPSVSAILWRATATSVVELSRGGCLFETGHVITAGAVGVLRVATPSGRAAVDGIRVVWSRLREGAATCVTGVELLPTLRETDPLVDGSLRDLALGLDVAFPG
jgi:hypothetical protein